MSYRRGQHVLPKRPLRVMRVEKKSPFEGWLHVRFLGTDHGALVPPEALRLATPEELRAAGIAIRARDYEDEA